MRDHASHQAMGHYGGLAFEMGVHFVIMYLVMYTMIATLDHFYLNINNLWMTNTAVSSGDSFGRASSGSLRPRVAPLDS